MKSELGFKTSDQSPILLNCTKGISIKHPENPLYQLRHNTNYLPEKIKAVILP